MSCISISVIPIEGGWAVEQENACLGQNQSENMALRSAIAEALLLREQGQAAKVSVRDECGEICSEYCLCKDFKIAMI
jgi:hypothetical protein